MNKNSKRLIVAITVLLAGLGVAGAATAGDRPEPANRVAPGAVAADSARAGDSGDATWQSGKNVERQRGIVVEGTSLAEDLSATVTVYENSLYGNSIQVVLGDPDHGGLIGSLEQTEPFVVGGVLNARVTIDGRIAELTGTVERTGRTTRVTEPVQDAGEQVISKGTHTQLLTDVTLSFDGQTVPLSFAPAFAYDLEVRRVDLYGR